jgi:hypothetical protein
MMQKFSIFQKRRICLDLQSSDIVLQLPADAGQILFADKIGGKSDGQKVSLFRL